MRDKHIPCKYIRLKVFIFIVLEISKNGCTFEQYCDRKGGIPMSLKKKMSKVPKKTAKWIRKHPKKAAKLSMAAIVALANAKK